MTLGNDDILTLQSHEAEDSILSVALIYADAATQLSEIVTPSDFYRRTEGRVFEIICRLNQTCVVSRQSVWFEMQAAGLVDDEYGLDWLIYLANNACTFDSAVYYAHKLKEITAKTRLAIHWQEQADAARNPSLSPADLLELDDIVTKRVLRDFQTDTATSSASSQLVEYLNRIQDGKLQQLIPQRGVLNGIEIGSGFVSVIGAPPGIGKTALAMQVMFDAIDLDESLRAVVANAETTFDGLLRRELTRITRINSNKIRFGNLDDKERAEL